MALSCLNLLFSLPGLLRGDDSSGSNLTHYVVLKFQSLGHLFQVYGCLVKEVSVIYKLSLDEYRFVPILDLVWANCDKNESTNTNKAGSFSSHPKNEVIEFWKIVKDGLALPLLIDLSYRTGLSLPACLIVLPAELKRKILESLPGVDIARMDCVCSEMRYLASNNDLWKQKFEEEFENRSWSISIPGYWKKMFLSYWVRRKKRNQAITVRQGFPAPVVYRAPYFFPIMGNPNP